MNPDAAGPDPWGSAVAPPDPHPEPWPRVSITSCTNPAHAHRQLSYGSPRPPPYPRYCTTAGAGPSSPRGTSSHAATGSPPNPGKRTSRISTSRRCPSTIDDDGAAPAAVVPPVAAVVPEPSAPRDADAAARASARVRDQKSSKSAGSETSGR